MKMSLQCVYLRIMALITSDNVLLSSPSFNEKTTAGFEWGGWNGLDSEVYIESRQWQGLPLATCLFIQHHALAASGNLSIPITQHVLTRKTLDWGGKGGKGGERGGQ